MTMSYFELIFKRLMWGQLTLVLGENKQISNIKHEYDPER